MKTRNITIYAFQELSPEAKEKAINNHRDWNIEGSEWWDCVFDDAKEIASLMGIEIDKIYFSGFWSQGDGASYTGSFRHAKGSVAGVKAYAPLDMELHRIADEIQKLQARSFYSASGTIYQRGHYYHEMTMHLSPGYEIKGQFVESDWLEVLRDFARWIYRRLEREHDYLTSDEAIAESLIANEREFDEEGNDA